MKFLAILSLFLAACAGPADDIVVNPTPDADPDAPDADPNAPDADPNAPDASATSPDAPTCPLGGSCTEDECTYACEFSGARCTFEKDGVNGIFMLCVQQCVSGMPDGSYCP